MRPIGRMLCAMITAGVMTCAAWYAGLPADDKEAAGEEEIHLAPDADRAGQPAMADPATAGRLRLSITEARPAYPAFCRVNVAGSDGNYYEPVEEMLAPWSLHRKGNRVGKGPFRYYGWFFYCDGNCDVLVPPGETRVEVWRGFETLPVTVTTMVETGKVAQLNLLLDRVIDLSKQGWYSGDTHIHLDRRTRDDDERCLDLAAAEDIRFAHILCMNDPRTYQPLMEQQLHPQLRGMGNDSVVRRGNWQIASGQEYRANTYGHICLVGGRRLVDAEGMKTDPNLWPPFGEVADELHSLGGYAFHAHGGYGKEIYADFAQRATDGVELLQFAEYRDIGLEGWYHILNAGYRFPAVGASDYPYCRALGDCRTYCYLPDGEPTFEDWDRAAAAGRSFFTTGPLLLLTVNDKQRPGDTIELPAGEQSLDVEISIYSPTVPIGEWQLIEGGIVRQRREMDARRSSQPLGRRRARWSERLTVRSSTWIAARVWGKSESGRVDVEAHTNPIYIRVGDTSPVQPASVEWLLKKLDERIAANAAREFPQKERLLSYMQRSRRALEELRGR